MSRAAALFTILVLATVAVPVATAVPVAAQAGMPDMSKAPPDIQAIWKKLMSGQAPTDAESAKLQAYIDAHKGSGNGSTGGNSGNSGGSPSDQGGKDCPAKSPLLAGLPTAAPGAAAAAALLHRLRDTYAGKESAEGRNALESIGKGVTDAAKLDWLGAELVVGQYPGAAVVVYADAAALGGPTARASWSGLGSALEEAGDDAHAAAAFRFALTLGPRDALDVYGLGVAYADLGDLSTGISLLTEATGMAPTFGLAWEALGRSQSCTGAMAMAAASMQKAQEVDWTGNRERVVRGPESDDDHVEARKPFPRPPGIALDPPPTPPAFPWTYPTLPSRLLQSAGYLKHLIEVETAYKDMMEAMDKAEGPAKDAARAEEDAAATPPAEGFTLYIDTSNRRQVLDAIDRLDQRMAARTSLIQVAYHDQLNTIVKRYTPQWAALEQKLDRCKEGHNCQMARCRAEVQLAMTEWQEKRGATAVMVGGYTGLSVKYDQAMRAWFRYANEPETQVDVDFDRRQQMAGLEGVTYGDASLLENMTSGDSVQYALCVKNGKLVPKPVDAKDAPGKPGPCKSKEADAKIIDIYSDCRSFRLTVGLGLNVKFEFNGATKGHHGSLFLGVGKGAGDLPISGFVGMQANWGTNGRITTAGIGLKGEAHALGNSFHVNETINGRSTGPAQEGSASVAVAPMFAGDIKGLSTQW